MARIRTIKPEFWTSAQVMECSPMTRLLFIGMWNFADDEGRMVRSAKTLKAQVFPSDPIEVEDIARMVVELAANALIRIYEVEGREFIQITGWHHQRIDKPHKSKIPRPVDAQSSNDSRPVGDQSMPYLPLSTPKGDLASGGGVAETSPLIEVLDPAALAAWDAHRRQTEGKRYPRNSRGGWCFPTKFPPGHEAEVQSLIARRAAQ
jgi:hypothetical protein